MSAPRDTDKRIDAWMDVEAPRRAPDDLLEGVYARTTTSRQLRKLPRVPHWPTGRSGRIVPVLVAASLVGLAGVFVVTGGGGQLALAPDATPSASLGSPTPSASLDLWADAAWGTAEARIPILGATVNQPFGIATTPDAVWVTSDRSIIRIDPVTNTPTKIDLPIETSAAEGNLLRWIAADDANVYVPDRVGRALLRVSAATQALAARVELPGGPMSVVAGADSVWVLMDDIGRIARIDPASDVVVESFAAPANAETLSSAFGDLWVGRSDSSVTRLDALQGTEIATIILPADVGSCDGGVAVGDEYWTECFTYSKVGRIDPATNTYIDSIETNGTVAGLIDRRGFGWTTQSADDAGPARMVRLDPDAGGIDAIVRLEDTEEPDAPVELADAVWIPIEGDNEVLRFQINLVTPP